MDFEALRARLDRPLELLGRGRHENFVVLIPLVELDGRDCLLFQKRAAGIRQAGEICFPGGAREPASDATLEDAARRETCEELGCAPERVQLLGRLGVIVSSSDMALDAFIGRLGIASLSDLRPNPREVARVFAVPVDELRALTPEIHHVRLEQHAFEIGPDGGRHDLLPAAALGLPPRYHSSWGGRQVPVRFYRAGGETIWGITAELVAEALAILPSAPV